MINNIQDLNKFVVSNNATADSILDKLADSKIIVSAKIAKLILRKIKPSNTPYATKAQM